MNAYRFDKVARGERYFVDTLLSFLLMENAFHGLRKLFRYVYGNDECLNLKEDFEIVTELDPLRDASVFHPTVREKYREKGRVAVPDMFVRWGNLCVVIEAKFFTDPSDDDIEEQLKAQKEAIESVKEYTEYKDCNIHYLVLTVRPLRLRLSNHAKTLTWAKLLDITKEDQQSVANIYCREAINGALARADREFSKITGVHFEKYKLDQLISNLTDLIKSGKVYVGFTGGLERLSTSTVEQLKNRDHYRVSDTEWTENWITIDRLLHRLLELGVFSK